MKKAIIQGFIGVIFFFLTQRLIFFRYLFLRYDPSAAQTNALINIIYLFFIEARYHFPILIIVGFSIGLLFFKKYSIKSILNTGFYCVLLQLLQWMLLFTIYNSSDAPGAFSNMLLGVPAGHLILPVYGIEYTNERAFFAILFIAFSSLIFVLGIYLGVKLKDYLIKAVQRCVY